MVPSKAARSVRRSRRALGLSQRELAARLGRSGSWLAHVESGRLVGQAHWVRCVLAAVRMTLRFQRRQARAAPALADAWQAPTTLALRSAIATPLADLIAAMLCDGSPVAAADLLLGVAPPTALPLLDEYLVLQSSRPAAAPPAPVVLRAAWAAADGTIAAAALAHAIAEVAALLETAPDTASLAGEVAALLAPASASDPAGSVGAGAGMLAGADLLTGCRRRYDGVRRAARPARWRPRLLFPAATAFDLVLATIAPSSGDRARVQPSALGLRTVLDQAVLELPPVPTAEPPGSL